MSLEKLLSQEFCSAWACSKSYGQTQHGCNVWDDLYAYCGGGPLDGIRF